MHKLEWDVCAAEGRGSRAHTVTKAQWLLPRLEDRRGTHGKYTGCLKQKYRNQGPTSSCWAEGYSVEGDDGGSSKARPSGFSKRPSFWGKWNLKRRLENTGFGKGSPGPGKGLVWNFQERQRGNTGSLVCLDKIDTKQMNGRRVWWSG